MLIVDRTDDRALHIRFRNLSRITVEFASQLREQIIRFCQAPCQVIEIDLGGIHFIDTKGFEALLELASKANENGIHLKLSSVSEDAWELIDLMQLTTSFNIHRAEKEIGELHPSLS